MRRQFGVGRVQPAGSSCMLQLDPLSLPASFEARDSRADGGVRHVDISREHIVVRRTVRGIRMAVSVRIRDYLGIACRETDEGQAALMLTHRDPSLAIPLFISSDTTKIENAWQGWSELFALPQIEEENDVAREPAMRRRRQNVVKWRHPRFLMRRKAGRSNKDIRVFRGEREIIARG